MALSKFQFKMKSTIPGINFGAEEEAGGQSIANFRRIYFEDSLFKFFPYGEVYYIDQVGIISDKLFFIEGMEFETKLGYNEEKQEDGGTVGGWLEHNYVWTEAQLNNGQPSNNVNGDQIFLLLSKHYMKNIHQSKSFNYEGAQQKMTISEILEKDLCPALDIPKNKQFISKTTGYPYVNQCNEMNGVFIENLSKVAYSISNQTSPFYTFINCNGEFYFMTIQELMQQPPAKVYVLDIAEDMQMNDKYIKRWETMHSGMKFNKYNYLRRFCTWDAGGQNNAEDFDIHTMTNYKVKDQNERLLVHRKFIPDSPVSTSYLGIQHLQDGPEYFKGFKNSYYRNTNLSYRMILLTQFNAKVIAGKTVEITVSKKMQNDEHATEYSGTWLITKSSHLFDKDGIPYSKLEIAKPKIRLDNNHPYKENFL